MTKATIQDIDQRLDILNVLIRSVIHLENTELSNALSKYKADNIQWVLNMVSEGFNELQDSLDLEHYSYK